MFRQPINVMVIPFRLKGEIVEYTIFKRADMGIWQFVTGGVESGESIETAAKRETFEESGISIHSKFFKLDSNFTVTIDNFPKLHEAMKSTLYVVPVHCFAVECDIPEIILSHEHTEFRWCNFDDCNKMLHFQNDKNVLWELDQRIKDNNLSQIQ